MVYIQGLIMSENKRFLDRVVEVEKAYEGKEFPTVLASSNLFAKSMIKIDPTVELVQEFHEAFDCHIEDTGPFIPTLTGAGNVALIEASRLMMKAREILRAQGKEDVRCCRVALIAEETAELASAFVEHDLAKILDAFTDIKYVVAGGIVNCGLQEVDVEATHRIHTSNMSKLGENGLPLHDETGKVIKGPNYKPVDLTDLVDGTWLKEQEELAKF